MSGNGEIRDPDIWSRFIVPGGGMALCCPSFIFDDCAPGCLRCGWNEQTHDDVWAGRLTGVDGDIAGSQILSDTPKDAT